MKRAHLIAAALFVFIVAGCTQTATRQGEPSLPSYAVDPYWPKVFPMVFSGDAQQQYVFWADGGNNQVHIIERATGRVLASFGSGGRYAGEFMGLHNIGIDSKGSIYTAEAGSGKRVQKFKRVAN